MDCPVPDEQVPSAEAKRAMDEAKIDHRCPKCKSFEIEMTTMGFFGRDKNKAKCCDCGWNGVAYKCEVPVAHCPRKGTRLGCSCPMVDGYTPRCADGCW